MPPPPQTNQHTHTAQRDLLPCVALKVALQWPLWWSMKENLYSGGYWQYFHDISHTKLHSVPCNKSNYFTHIKSIFTEVSSCHYQHERGIHTASYKSVKSWKTCMYVCLRKFFMLFRMIYKGTIQKERWSMNVLVKCKDMLNAHHLFFRPSGLFIKLSSHTVCPFILFYSLCKLYNRSTKGLF